MQKREKTEVETNHIKRAKTNIRILYRTMFINKIINNCVNAHFPKVEVSTNQVETQKRVRISQASNQQQQSRNEKS